MLVSSRQRMILNILLAESREITINEIAERIAVSTRTIHRELNDMEPLLTKHHIALIKKSGIGVFLEGELENKEKLLLTLRNEKIIEYSAEERKLLILCQLLEATEPVKLFSMTNDLRVTTATISNDLDELDDWLKKYELTLIRKRGYGVELYGSETAKRKAMSTLISENLDEAALLGVLRENIHGKSLNRINTVSERLLGLIEKEKLVMIENALRDLKSELPYPLADSSFIGLAIHLSLAIERIEKGEKISFAEDYLTEIAPTPEFKMAEKIIQRLRNIFNLDIPIAEIGYITMHLRGAKMRSSYEDCFEFKNVELASKINGLISFCGERLGSNLNEDRTLMQGLLAHIEPAIFRIQKNMKIRNPLLSEIKTRYDHLFLVVKDAVEHVFSDMLVPEEEIGYLVMHIGASVERKRVEYNNQYRALVVCASGIGSSKILASRIKKEIPNIAHIQNISMFDIEKKSNNNYDLIISTVPLFIDSQEYILVSPLLTKEDVQNIRNYLGNLGYRQQSEIPCKRDDLLGALKGWQAYIETTVQIMENLQCGDINNTNMSLEELLEAICDRAEQGQLIRNKQVVVQKLLQREKMGGLGIPNVQLALFHSRNAEVLEPCFMLHYLQKPIIIKSMEDSSTYVDKILLLLAPEKISKEGLEILSEISSLLLEEEMLEIFAAKQQSLIYSFFLKKLYNNVSNKIGGDH